MDENDLDFANIEMKDPLRKVFDQLIRHEVQKSETQYFVSIIKNSNYAEALTS